MQRLVMKIVAVLVVTGMIVVLGMYARHTALESAPAEEQGPRQSAEEEPDVEGLPAWVLRGTRLLVKGRWVLNPTDGTFTELPYAMVKERLDGYPDPLSFSVSPSGESIVLWDEHEFRFGPVLGPLQGPWPIPDLEPRGSADAVQGDRTLRQVFFWGSARQLALYQIERIFGRDPSCGIYQATSHEWGPVAECPRGHFHEVVQVDLGERQWIVIYSGAEGMSGLRIARYDAMLGQYGPEAPNYGTSFGQLQAYVSLEGDRVDLVTSCVLLSLEEAECEGRGEEEPWRLYSWRPGEEHLELVSERLPPNAVPAPVGRQVAWMEGEQVCVAEVEALERARCFCLPGHECSSQPAER